jgi:hypothetical protein
MPGKSFSARRPATFTIFQIKKKIERCLVSSSFLPFLSTSSRSTNRYSKLTHRDTAQCGVSLLMLWEKVPGRAHFEHAETRRHRSTAADLGALALSLSPALPTTKSAPADPLLSLASGYPGPHGRRYESELGCLERGHGDGRAAWMVGGRVAFAGVVSGAEGSLSRLIGMRLLDASRVTRWGLFLMRGEVHSVASLAAGPTFFFFTL